MTSIICWLNKEEKERPALWVVGDSKISTQLGTESTITLSDYGIKIFTLPIVCRKPGITGFINEVYFVRNIGMAYAGHSFLGLNFYAIFSHFLANLGSTPESFRPSMNDVADVAKKILGKLAKQYCESVNDLRGKIEVFLFGFCEAKGSFTAFRINHSSGLNFTLEESDLERPESIALLGSHKEEIENKIIMKRRSMKNDSLMWWRAPKNLLQEIIADGSMPDVGGSLQLAISKGKDMQIFSCTTPVEIGKPAATQIFTGLDIFDDLGPVGNNFINLPSMI